MNVHRQLPRGKYRLTIHDFMRLDETGVFGADRTELLDGDIIIMNAEYRPHGRIVDELKYRLRRVLEDQDSDLFPMTASIALSDHDMPLPDIVLTREPRGAGPVPLETVALLVEVSSTTHHRDMRDKLGRYAQAGIPEYWIVDVDGRVVHQFWSPIESAFSQQRMIEFGHDLISTTTDALSIPTDDL